MDAKNLNDRELRDELSKATHHLRTVESEYVQAQNVCAVLEREVERRHAVEVRGVAKVDMKALAEKWRLKAEDIQRAADALAGDPLARHSLMMQADLIRSCVTDLEKLLEGSQTATNHT